MRQLIDANELRDCFKINECCEDCYYNNRGNCDDKAIYTLHDVCTMIDDVGVIDAIPVEWIRSQLKNNPNDIESAYNDICINELIDRWQKGIEQEAR